LFKHPLHPERTGVLDAVAVPAALRARPAVATPGSEGEVVRDGSPQVDRREGDEYPLREGGNGGVDRRADNVHGRDAVVVEIPVRTDRVPRQEGHEETGILTYPPAPRSPAHNAADG